MGIGLATARVLAERGARLVLVARGAAALEETCSALPGAGHSWRAFDVADDDAWRSNTADLDELFGLVCAAAVIAPIGPIGSYEPTEFARTMAVNLSGTFLAVHHCLPALRRGGGSIVTFSGGGATSPQPRYDAYAASKAAVARLTENLAAELAREGICINAVAPGFVSTRMHEATLAAGPEAAGREYYDRTVAGVADGGFPASEAAELVCRLLEGVTFSGKLVSAKWDPWRDPAFHRRLAGDASLATLRRIDGMEFGRITDVRSTPGEGLGMLSVVIPAYNEEENVEPAYARLAPVLDGIGEDWELIFSVDPSTDNTEAIILALRERDPRVKMLRFSRRFGQPMAVLAGMEAASGDAVIVIDCDLQDPPELIPELVAKWREGFDVVYAQRSSRDGETLSKRLLAGFGYRVIERISDVKIPPNTGEFRLMSRRVVDHVVALRESHGFLRGLVSLVGYRQTGVLYDRQARAAGTSKYNRFIGSLVIGLNGIVGFSRYPLQVISLLGVLLSAFAFCLAGAYFVLTLSGHPFPVGNPTIVILVTFFSGIQLLSLGVMGEYVGRIYDEVRQRPKYIVESRYGLNEH
jgi:polyisoprenyl-phosphate glycosyltransferase